MSAVKYKPKVIQINTIVRHIYKYFVRESKRDNYILTHGFGTPESGYATLSKFWKSLTNEGAKSPSWLNFPKTWIMLHNHSRAFQNQLLIYKYLTLF